MGQRKITAVSDQRDLANLFKNTLCVFTLRLYSSPQFEAKATVTPAIRAKNSPSAVFSRLGRLYLWNNFCKVLLWNNCSSRHKHTYFIQSTTESMTANTFSFSLLVSGREEKRRGHHLSSYDHGPPTTNVVSQGDHTHTQALQKQAVLYITWHKHI